MNLQTPGFGQFIFRDSPVSIRRRDFFSSLAVGQQMLAWGVKPGPRDAMDDFRTRIIVGEELDWDALRREFVLDQRLAYLNSGSIGCTPRILLEQIHQTSLALEQNPFHHVWEDGLAGDLEQVRERIAESFSVTSAEIALTENTTSGLYAIGSGIPWQADDELIVSNHEHLSCMAVWKFLQRKHNLTIRYVEIPLPDYSHDEFLSRLKSQLTDRTRACCFSHVDSFTGLRLPIGAISELTRPANILLVCDAAQSLGMSPVDFRSLGADALAGSGHKWLMGSKGTGLLYISRDAQDRIRPQIADWSFGALTPATGTRNIAQLLGWGITMEIQKLLEPDRIGQRIQELSAELLDRLRKIPGVEPLVHYEPRSLTGMTAFRFGGITNSLNLAKRLARDSSVLVKPLPTSFELAEDGHQPTEYRALRFSTHIYNNMNDIESAEKALRATT